MPRLVMYVFSVLVIGSFVVYSGTCVCGIANGDQWVVTVITLRGWKRKESTCYWVKKQIEPFCIHHSMKKFY